MTIQYMCMWTTAAKEEFFATVHFEEISVNKITQQFLPFFHGIFESCRPWYKKQFPDQSESGSSSRKFFDFV